MGIDGGYVAGFTDAINRHFFIVDRAGRASEFGSPYQFKTEDRDAAALFARAAASDYPLAATPFLRHFTRCPESGEYIVSKANLIE
jgi:hypothetical protein